MFKVLDEVCKPTKGSKYSAAVDLYAREDVIIGAGETVKVPLGVCIDESKLEKKVNEFYIYDIERTLDVPFKDSHYLQLEPRSSLRAKGLQAGTGIIDLDYPDEIMIILHNQSMKKAFVPFKGHENIGSHVMLENDKYKIKKGEKIAQIMLCEHKTYLMGIESDEERTGGFGSTGN